MNLFPNLTLFVHEEVRCTGPGRRGKNVTIVKEKHKKNKNTSHSRKNN